MNIPHQNQTNLSKLAQILTFIGYSTLYFLLYDFAQEKLFGLQRSVVLLVLILIINVFSDGMPYCVRSVHGRILIPFARMEMICFVYTTLSLYFNDKSKNINIIDFFVYIPYMIDILACVKRKCTRYVHHLFQNFTAQSVVHFSICLLMIALLFVCGVIYSGNFFRAQLTNYGDQYDLLKFIRKEIVMERPADKRSKLTLDTIQNVPYTGGGRNQEVVIDTLYRFLGEDVKMKCAYEIDNYHFCTNSYTLWWRHKYAMGVYEKQHVMDVTHRFYGSKCLVITDVVVNLAHEQDFGLYECWGGITYTSVTKGIITEKLSLRAVFNVTRMPYVDKTVYAPVGVFMAIILQSFVVSEKGESVKFYHRLANISRPSSYQYFSLFPGSSPLIEMYAAYVNGPFFTKFPFRSVMSRTLYHDNLFPFLLVFGTHPNVFSTHTFYIERNANMTENKLYELPFSLTLIPDFGVFYSDTGNETFDDINQSCNPIQNEYLAIVIWYVRHGTDVILIAIIFEILKSACSNLLAKLDTSFILLIQGQILKRNDINRFINRFSEPCFKITSNDTLKAATPLCNKTGRRQLCKFELLTLYEQKHEADVLNHLVIPLKMRRIRVQFPAWEWEYKMGLPKYKIYAEAAESSKKILIALSNSFLQNYSCMYNFLTCMVIARVQNGEITTKDVCIVRLDSCEIPRDVRQSLPGILIINLKRAPKKGRHFSPYVDQIIQWVNEK